MAERAHYKKLDFVDYFKALTETRDEWIEQFISRPKCLAVLEALVSDCTVLGRALFAVADELSDFHRSVHSNIVLQAARRHDLPETDPRHISFHGASKSQYPEFFPAPSVKGTAQDFWHVERRPAEAINVYEGTEISWSAIRSQNEMQYLDYWKLTNHEEYHRLLAHRVLLAMVDAFDRRQDDLEPWDHLGYVVEFAGSDLPSLEPRLRPWVLAHFCRDIRLGIIELPDDLQRDFPQTYADRGIE